MTGAYAHETRKKLIPKEPGKDRRFKLTAEQREEIKNSEGISNYELARIFGVSRRTIQFIRNPESYDEMLKRREERGGWKKHYDPEVHKLRIREHRRYKRKLYMEGQLIERRLEGPTPDLSEGQHHPGREEP